MWRWNLVARFGDIPWGAFALPLSLSLVAVVAVIPLWNLSWRWAVAIASVSTAYALSALPGSGMGNGGLFLNGALLASVAAAPIVMHSNNSLKRRRAKRARP
jgi:hypothetical protein